MEGSECLEAAAAEGRWDQQGIKQIDGQRNKWFLKGLGRVGHCHLPEQQLWLLGDEGVEDDRRWPKIATASAQNMGWLNHKCDPTGCLVCSWPPSEGTGLEQQVFGALVQQTCAHWTTLPKWGLHHQNTPLAVSQVCLHCSFHCIFRAWPVFR